MTIKVRLRFSRNEALWLIARMQQYLVSTPPVLTSTQLVWPAYELHHSVGIYSLLKAGRNNYRLPPGLRKQLDHEAAGYWLLRLYEFEGVLIAYAE